jgi:4-hydroxybenzoate polyprenyltransferase
MMALRLTPDWMHNIRSLSWSLPRVDGLPVDEVPVRLCLVLGTTWMAYWFAQVLNDYSDVEADRVNGQPNLFASDALPGRVVWASAAAVLAGGLAGSLSLGFLPFRLFVTAVLLSVSYSIPPVRLKKCPGLSALNLSAYWTVIFGYGFAWLSDWHWPEFLPLRLWWAPIIAIPLGLQVKDLKDADGDRRTCVWSLPTLLGPVRGKRVVIACVFVSFTMAALWLPHPIVRVLSALLAVAISWAVWRMSAINAYRSCVAAAILLGTVVVATYR